MTDKKFINIIKKSVNKTLPEFIILEKEIKWIVYCYKRENLSYENIRYLVLRKHNNGTLSFYDFGNELLTYDKEDYFLIDIKKEIRKRNIKKIIKFITK
jgi:hypothetical protein